MREPIRLHIGGTERRDGWTVMNIQPGPNVDVVGCISDLSRFDDASAEVVYASHVYEHLTYVQCDRAFREAFRVLRPSGTFMVAVPDFARLAWIASMPDMSAQDRFEVMRRVFGGQVDEHDQHRSGWTDDVLMSVLHHIGFLNIKRLDSFNVFNDMSNAHFAGVPISLNIEAVKP